MSGKPDTTALSRDKVGATSAPSVVVVANYQHHVDRNTPKMMSHKARPILLGLLAFLLMGSSAIACGSAEKEPSDETTVSSVTEDAVVTIGDRPELRVSTRPSSMFEVDDFVGAGWKKNKEYALDTLPEAQAAVFGFYNRKDIELRFYPSHEVAMSAGKASAEEAIATEKVSGRGAGFSSVTLYGAYVIAGNVVMLCEFSVQDCTDLLDNVPQ